MQEVPKGIPKLGCIRRVHSADTLEFAGKNKSATLSNITRSISTTGNGTTMMPREIIPLDKLPKKETEKKEGTESKELELQLLYNEYLQTMMMDLIMKKKTEEKKNLMIRQLATIAHEIDQDTNKLIQIKTRERDIINLTQAQKEIDIQVALITKCTKDKTFKIVKDIASKLQSLLEPLDVLRCNGIILPETQDEWEDTREILAKCSNVLKDIINLIGSKGKTYCAVNTGLKNFAETNNEIENLQKKLEEVLCNLQVLMLKNVSLTLTQYDSQ